VSWPSPVEPCCYCNRWSIVVPYNSSPNQATTANCPLSIPPTNTPSVAMNHPSAYCHQAVESFHLHLLPGPLQESSLQLTRDCKSFCSQFGHESSGRCASSFYSANDMPLCFSTLIFLALSHRLIMLYAFIPPDDSRHRMHFYRHSFVLPLQRAVLHFFALIQ
jgi:hypothetical protein